MRRPNLNGLVGHIERYPIIASHIRGEQLYQAQLVVAWERLDCWEHFRKLIYGSRISLEYGCSGAAAMAASGKMRSLSLTTIGASAS